MGQITLIGASTSQIVTVEDGALLGKLYGDWEYAIADGEAYVWTNSAIDGYDYTAKDTVLAVENNSTTKDLYIQRVVINGDTASQWVMFVESGITMTGTAITGRNLNRASGKVAPATAIQDETGATQADTYLKRVLSGRFANAGIADVPIEGGIILPNDHMIGVDFTTDGGTCNVTFWGYFK